MFKYVEKKWKSIGTDSLQPCDLNYLSFKACLSDLKPTQVIRRKLKDVGLPKTKDKKKYTAHVNCPEGVEIEVTPSELRFVVDARKEALRCM